MPNSRRQSAVESQPNPSSNPPKATPSSTAHQPAPAGARLESSINRKFHALGTPTNATNASTPTRNSISRAALSSEPRGLPKQTDHNHVNHDTATTQPEATIGNHNKPSSLTGSKKQNSRTAAGLGLPSSTTGTIPAKRSLTTSDIPSTTSNNNNKKNKQEGGAQSKNEKNLPLSVDTLRCHQCRAEVPLENVIMCSNENCARTIPRKRRSESGQNLSAKSPANFLQAPCRISFCGRCLSARYGEDLKKVRPTVNASYEWDCPVCQDYCNCSICRKKKGLPPTGKLAKAATQAGFSSARELLAANPNAQGPDVLTQEAKRKESSGSTATSQAKPKPDGTNKKLMKLKTPGSLTPKSKKPMATTTNKLMTKKTNHKKKMSSQDPKHLEVVKKLKKQQQLGKSKAKKSDPSPSSSSNKKASASSKQAPSAPLVNGNNKVTEQSAAAEVITKAPGRRAPHVVQAPVSYSCFPTGILSSGQILKRLHVREFICRFKDLIPGLGATEAKNSRTESQRAEKIIDSMDDLVNFWIDDEGGMRAIMNGLTRLIEADFNLVDHSSADRASSSPILKSDASPPLLAQLKRECKNSSTPIPYHQNSVPCWNTAIRLLKEEGLESTFEKDTEDPYISSVDGSPTSEHSGDERLQRVKFPPVKKLAIISALIDIALRGHTLCEDLIQGLEREKQAKSDILKERVKLNKKWTETKAQKMSTMPSKKSLLVTSEDGQMIQKPSKALMDQETARVQALAEWEADMSQAECVHKNEIRKSFIDQYKVESLNRLRFQSIGQDSRKNTYYILSSTPGVLYPNDPVELAYAWSYSLIIHGSEPTNLKGKKKSQAPKKTNQSATTATTSSATDSSMAAAKADQHEETQIDMLEGGQRAPNDQWIRISEPKEIRQLASWIEYEAKLVDFKNSINSSSASSSSSSGTNKKTPNSNIAKPQRLSSHHALADPEASSLNPNDTSTKSVANLVELVHRFSEFLDLKISQHLESIHNDRRGLKSRNH